MCEGNRVVVVVVFCFCFFRPMNHFSAMIVCEAEANINIHFLNLYLFIVLIYFSLEIFYYEHILVNKIFNHPSSSHLCKYEIRYSWNDRLVLVVVVRKIFRKIVSLW